MAAQAVTATGHGDDTRYLFVVSRRDRSLYQYVVRAFASAPEIQVIYDRRQSARRRTAQTPAVERRQSDRRARPRVDADILDYGSAMVRIG
jgi:hypothetical protein